MKLKVRSLAPAPEAGRGPTTPPEHEEPGAGGLQPALQPALGAVPQIAETKTVSKRSAGGHDEFLDDDERSFRDGLAQFLTFRSRHDLYSPIFLGTPLPFHTVFGKVRALGGYDVVCEQKLWMRVCRYAANGKDLSGQTSASFAMRKNYEKTGMLQWERHLRVVDDGNLPTRSSTLQNDRSRSPGVLGKGRKLCATCDGIVGSATRVCPHCNVTILAGKRGTTTTTTTTTDFPDDVEMRRAVNRKVVSLNAVASGYHPRVCLVSGDDDVMDPGVIDGLGTMEDTSDDDVDDEELARLEEKVTAARGALEEKSKSLREKLALSTAPIVNTSRVGAWLSFGEDCPLTQDASAAFFVRGFDPDGRRPRWAQCQGCAGWRNLGDAHSGSRRGTETLNAHTSTQRRRRIAKDDMDDETDTHDEFMTELDARRAASRARRLTLSGWAPELVETHVWGPNRGNTLGWGCEPTPKEEPMATTEELRGAAVEAAGRVNTGGVVGRVASAVDALAAAATALATGGTYEHLVEGEVEEELRVPTSQGDSQGAQRGADAGTLNTAVSNPVTPAGLIEARREGSDGGSEAFTLEAMVAAAEASESGDQTPASGLIEPEGLIEPQAEPGIHEEAPEAEEAPAKVPPKLTFVMKRPERSHADGETRHAREALEGKEKSLREKLAATTAPTLDLDANPSEEDAQLCTIDGVEHVEHVEHLLRPVVNDGDPPPPTQLCRCVPRVPTGWRRWETIRAKPNANGSMAADCYYRTPDDGSQGSRSYVLRSEKEIEEFLSEDAAPNGSNRFSSGEQLVSMGMFWCRPFTRARTGGKRRARTGTENVPGEAGRAPKTHKWRGEHLLGGVDAATAASHEVGSPRVEEPAKDTLKDTTEEEERGSLPPPVDAAPEPEPESKPEPQPEPEPGLFVPQLAALPSPAPPPTQPVTQRPVTTPPPSSPPPGPIAHTAAAVPDDIEAMREQIRAQLKEELRAQVEAELRREIAAEYVTARNAADEDARAERVMHESK